MKFSIAVAGKGGTGKTTLAALVVRSLRELGVRPILAVDADPNSNLADALGIAPGKPLAEIREQGSSPEGSPASGVGRARAVDDEIHRAIAEAEGFDLITMGRPEGPRCYCYVNNLLRKSLDDLSKNYAAVVLDNEAGMEHLSRRTTNNVDVLVAVMNPALPAVRAAKRVVTLCRELPIRIGRQAILVNRVGPAEAESLIAGELAGLDVERLADVPQDDELERAGAMGRDVFSVSDESPAVIAVQGVIRQLCATLSVATE
ncbi:MAG: AAA family ATPase [Pirellulales bacterium]|nr:AAA family ATPase [Pirellulales bacterium]